MNFYKLSPKHKRMFIGGKVAIVIMMIIMLAVSLQVADVDLPTVQSQLSVGIGFIGVMTVFVLALVNRINILFKIKSIGFVIMFLLLLAIREGIDIFVWSIGLMSIPLLIDDMILTPLWLNVWYKEYDNWAI